jgi:hypothetical protein
LLKNDAIVVHFFTQQMRAIANNDLCLMSKIISQYFFTKKVLNRLERQNGTSGQEESASKEGKHGEKTPSTIDDAP